MVEKVVHAIQNPLLKKVKEKHLTCCPCTWCNHEHNDYKYHCTTVPTIDPSTSMVLLLQKERQLANIK